MAIQVSPSILSADFNILAQEIAELEPYSERIHFDVMDGHFVPNISFGAPVLKWIKSKLPIDVHLMIENPEQYIEDFAKAGADLIVVHSEVCDDLPSTINKIKDLGVMAGVSIKPKTPVSDIKEYLSIMDQVLIMTVEPGFGGQSFMEDMLPKIKELKDLGFEGDIAIDGGVNAETGTLCRDAGADILIAGSYIFGAEDRIEAIAALRG